MRQRDRDPNEGEIEGELTRDEVDATSDKTDQLPRFSVARQYLHSPESAKPRKPKHRKKE